MQRIPRDLARKFAFDWRDHPLLRVEPGEPFEVETFDASNGYIQTEHDKAIPARRPGFDRVPPLANPIAGPIWVEGARRGDVLIVVIEEIQVDDYSWIAIGPGRGPLGQSTRWPELSSEYTTKIFRHTPGPSGTTRDGTLHFDAASDPAAYERRNWSVDRMHPNERGHRLIARRFHALLAESGFPVGQAPDLEPTSPPPTRLAEIGWMATKGTAWVVKRSTDLVPALLALAVRERLTTSRTVSRT